MRSATKQLNGWNTRTQHIPPSANLRGFLRTSFRCLHGVDVCGNDGRSCRDQHKYRTGDPSSQSSEAFIFSPNQPHRVCGHGKHDRSGGDRGEKACEFQETDSLKFLGMAILRAPRIVTRPKYIGRKANKDAEKAHAPCMLSKTVQSRSKPFELSPRGASPVSVRKEQICEFFNSGQRFPQRTKQYQSKHETTSQRLHWL